MGYCDIACKRNSFSLTGGTAMTTPLRQKMMEDLQLHVIFVRKQKTKIIAGVTIIHRVAPAI